MRVRQRPLHAPLPTHTHPRRPQAAKEANRRRMEAKYAAVGPFKLQTTERPANLDKIRSEIEQDIARQLTFQPPKPHAMPPPPTAQVRAGHGAAAAAGCTHCCGPPAAQCSFTRIA